MDTDSFDSEKKQLVEDYKRFTTDSVTALSDETKTSCSVLQVQIDALQKKLDDFRKDEQQKHEKHEQAISKRVNMEMLNSTIASAIQNSEHNTRKNVRKDMEVLE